MEQSQEIKIPDGMPDIGRVLSAWGQTLLRGKEWQGNRIGLSAGMTVWVLYMPEDGTEPKCLESWIPFHIHWDLPEDTPEGQLRSSVLTRFVDARSVSARKLLIRCGAAAMVEAFAPMEVQICTPEAVPQDVQLLRSSYPVRLPTEAGERAFFLDEELMVPGSVPQPRKLIYHTLQPEIAEQKVLADRMVFRGNGRLHILYRTEDGGLQSWDFSVPFSQFAQLQKTHSDDAQGDMLLCPTSLELELDDSGHLRLKCGLVGQYLVTDRHMVELVEDAYSPGRAVDVQQEMLRLPALLDNRRENLFGEGTVPTDGQTPVDVQYLSAFPGVVQDGTHTTLGAPGLVQVLYYGDDGALRSAVARWETQLRLPADESSRITALLLAPPQLQLSQSADGISARLELPVQISASAGSGISMVTGLGLGEVREPDPGRPSLILRRAGDGRLWELAKASGSTVESIRAANQLEGTPAPEQMLLIPVM